jgi:hypothetical protein
VADTLPFASVESPVISEFVRETIRMRRRHCWFNKMRGAHQVAGKRNVFAFAVYSPGRKIASTTLRVKGALEDALLNELNHHDYQNRKEAFR